MEAFDDNTPSNHEIVILVHGTYAGAKEDEGTHW